MKFYHYTNQKAFNSMQTSGIDNYSTLEFDELCGLIPQKRFIDLNKGNKNLPNSAYDPIFEGLLEPEPQYCINNPKFPDYFKWLFEDITRSGLDILLLSFEIKPTDKIDIVDRAHIETMLYNPKLKPVHGNQPAIKHWKKANQKYLESKVPALEYKGGYELPQFICWDAIQFERINIEWLKPNEEVREMFGLVPFAKPSPVNPDIKETMLKKLFE